MKKILFTILLLIFLSPVVFSQVKINEGFETSDSAHLPLGWSKWNNAAFQINPKANWTVKDTGSSIVLVTGTSKAHTGRKACVVSWGCAIDTATGATTNADAWLVTKRLVPSVTDSISFWATGGSSSYSDSMQVWIGVIDSIPSDITVKVSTIYWPMGSTYGNFSNYKYSLHDYAGQTIWIGFRYVSNGNGSSGYAVHLDDVFVGTPIGITPISTNLPKEYALKQNYPNPFNPTTNINFDLPHAGFVNLIVFNMLGQQVSSLVNQDLKAGSYKVDWNAQDLPSGTYFYKITAGSYVKTNKMILVK